MQVSLHRDARTTPTIRRELQASSEPTEVLARRYTLSPITVRKWRQRESVENASHRPATLHANRSPGQELVAVELRKTLPLPLDDLLAVTREFPNPTVSRSGLDRCLRRHGVSRLAAPIPREQADKTPPKTFKDYAPGFVHVDVKYLPQMPDEDARRNLFAAIDRATRWVYVEILPNKTGAHAVAHRLIRPRHPQTNGTIARFNRRIGEILATTRLRSGEQLHETLARCVTLYNAHIPQRALHHATPMEKLKAWHRDRPDLFSNNPPAEPGAFDCWPLKGA